LREGRAQGTRERRDGAQRREGMERREELTMSSLSVFVKPNEYGKAFIEFAETHRLSSCGKVPISCGNLLR
jgi:hypothetical protein